MEQSFVEKMRRLEQLAQQDEICRDYRATLEQLKPGMDKLLRFLPRPLRRRVEAYGKYRDMLHQRMLVLACQNMEFQDKK